MSLFTRTLRRLALVAAVGMLLAVSLTPAAAETAGKNWSGTFFNNIYFTGPAAETDVLYPNGLYFNWGYGAPKKSNGSDLNVGSDNFSAIFVSQQRFNKADYLFTVRANDGVRIYIDDYVVLDQMVVVTDIDFFNQYQFSYPMEEGLHQIRVEYVEYTGQSLLHVLWGEDGSYGVFFEDNRFCFAPGQTDAAIYIVNDGFHIYGINPDSSGYLAVEVTARELNNLPTVPTANMRVKSGRQNTIQLYKLVTGEFQLNIGPDIAGKTYSCIFDGVSPSYAKVSSFELYER